MNITGRTKSGLSILIYIASYADQNRITTAPDISCSQKIPKPYLEQLLLILKKGGLISTVRGRNGGYRAAKPPEKITLLDIIEVFEGEINFLSGYDRLTGNPVTVSLWKELTKAFRQLLKKVSLKELVEKKKKWSLDYVI